MEGLKLGKTVAEYRTRLTMQNVLCDFLKRIYSLEESKGGLRFMKKFQVRLGKNLREKSLLECSSST